MEYLKKVNRIKLTEKDKKRLRVKLNQEKLIHDRKRNQRYGSQWDVK